MLLNILTETTTDLPVEETVSTWEKITDFLNDYVGLIVLACTVASLLLVAVFKGRKKRK